MLMIRPISPINTESLCPVVWIMALFIASMMVELMVDTETPLSPAKAISATEEAKAMFSPCSLALEALGFLSMVEMMVSLMDEMSSIWS